MHSIHLGRTLITAFLISSCPPVFGQSPAPTPASGATEDGYGEEITVNGQQQERTRQETVESVAVLSGPEIEQSTRVSLYDVVAETPNVSQSFGYKGFSIRGIDQRGSGSGNGLLVSVKVDGVTLQNDESTFFGPYSAWDLDQVEIFRGPQSTQQGRNSLAGAIIVNSADPTYDNEIKGRVSYGSLNTWQASAAVNLPLVESKAAFRLSVDQRKSDGWVENPTRGEDDYDFREALTVRGKLRFDPTERFRGLLSLSYTDSTGGEDLIDESQFSGDRFNFSDEAAEEGSEHQLASLELSYDLADSWTLESTTSTYMHDYIRIEDSDLSAFPGNLLDIDQEDEGLTQQLRVLYSGERFDGVFGLYYADLDDDSIAVATLPGEVLGIPGVSITGSQATTESTENLAVFGELDLQLANDWKLTVGARFDDEERTTETIQESRINPPIFELPSAPPELLDASYSAFLPKIAIGHDWSDLVSTSFAVQRGYRAGGRSLSLISQRLSDFDPEFTTNYEFALRSRSADRRWLFNANLFYADWEDQQVAVRTEFDLEFDTVTVNAGSSTFYGLESQIEYQPSQDLRLYASLGFVETEFDEFVDADQDFSGNEFPFAPSWSWTLGGNWQFADSWSADAQITSQDSFFSDPANQSQFEVDGRTVVNAKVGYRWDRWGVNVFARNLLDEDYLLERLPSGSRSGEPQVFGLEWTFGI